MQTLAEPTTVDPSESTILIYVAPHYLPQDVLDTLARAAVPAGRDSDVLREWLAESVRTEQDRRATYGDWSEPPEYFEPPAWKIPWHRWNDRQLAAALACACAWRDMQLSVEEVAVFTAIHVACVTAACTRLGELHSAIESAAEKRAKDFADA